MSRRLHPCRTCKPSDGGKFTRRGFTRHADRVCSWCRRLGAPDPFPGRWRARGA